MQLNINLTRVATDNLAPFWRERTFIMFSAKWKGIVKKMDNVGDRVHTFSGDKCPWFGTGFYSQSREY